MDNVNVNHKKSNNSRKLYGLILSIVTVIVIILLLLRACTAPEGSVGVLPDVDIGAEVVGSNKLSPEELTAYLQKQVDASQFSWEVNTKITLKDGVSDANVGILNPRYNVFPLVVEITLDDTGELIYKSGAILPNYYVEFAKFRKPLNKGHYKATATINGYDPDDKKFLGKAQAAVDITVLN